MYHILPLINRFLGQLGCYLTGLIKVLSLILPYLFIKMLNAKNVIEV